jgi:hypothetical protein
MDLTRLADPRDAAELLEWGASTGLGNELRKAAGCYVENLMAVATHELVDAIGN